MTDPPIAVDEHVTAVRRRRTVPRKLVGGVTSLVVVITGFFVAPEDASETSVQVSANQPGGGSGQLNPSLSVDGVVPPATASSLPPPPPPLGMTSTTAPPPVSTSTTRALGPTTSTAPMDGNRTPVMTAPDGQWSLTRVDSGSHRCLELTVGTSTAGRLLCDAPGPNGLWGEYAIVDTPVGWGVVAMVDARLTGMQTLFGGGMVAPGFGADPFGEKLHYAAGLIQNLGGSTLDKGVDVFLMQGENTLGRAKVSLAAGRHPPPSVRTTHPYGFWPGYRKAGYTGLFWGGNEDVGFYDAPSRDGTRCLVWRRFGGPQEAVIVDVCPTPVDAVFPFAELRTEPQADGTLVRAAIVVDAPNVTGWACTWDTGRECFFSGQAMADAPGPGRWFLGYFPGAFQRNGESMTVTAYDGQRIIGQVTVPVQPAPFPH